MTLVEFLRARVAEDERVALACGVQLSDGKLYLVGDGDTITIDARRVLREVEAKRRLIADFEMYDASARYPDPEGGIAIGLGTAVELAALAYADHPDYDEAWRPA